MKKKYFIMGGILLALLTVFLLWLYVPERIAVLGYHSFYKDEKESANEFTMNIEDFEKQMKYLHDKGYKTLTLDEFYCWKEKKCKQPHKSVLITLDDGYLSNYMYALEVLAKYDLNATIFIIGENAVNGINEGKNTDFMSLELIKKIKEEYKNIEFASHTYALHYEKEEGKDYESIRMDSENFKNIISTEYHAYPFGLFTEEMKQAYKDEGYKLAFGFGPTSKEFRKSTRKDDNYNIPRLSMNASMSLTKFKLLLLLPK